VKDGPCGALAAPAAPIRSPEVRAAAPRSRVRRARDLGVAAACGATLATAWGLSPHAGAQTAPAEVTLAPGASGQPVRDLQAALVRFGQRIAIDGQYGPRTTAAVRRAQTRLGLPTTGVADAELLGAIGLSCTRPAPSAGRGTPGASRFLLTFPVSGEDYFYSADFGAPRSQGGHQGNDIIAPKGTPVLAVGNGAILRMTRKQTGLGGIWIWLRDAAGNEFYYAHLDTIAAGLKEGSRVTAGQQIATVGNTGDARYGAHHLHFEIHPGGGAAIDPFNDLRAIDPRPEASRGRAAPSPIVCVQVPAIAPQGAAEPAVAPAAAPARPKVTLSIRQLRINQRISQAAVRRVNEIRHRLGGPPPPPPAPPGVVELTVAQLTINQRISQAAVRRVNQIEASLARKRVAQKPPPAAPAEPGGVRLSAGQLLINQRISQAAVRRVNALAARIEAAAGPDDPRPRGPDAVVG
jgi:murein DD-endopeptidase MepM/ murein hydrolase activator NlpD